MIALRALAASFVMEKTIFLIIREIRMSAIIMGNFIAKLNMRRLFVRAKAIWLVRQKIPHSGG